jgi:hypothetical protein
MLIGHETEKNLSTRHASAYMANRARHGRIERQEPKSLSLMVQISPVRCFEVVASIMIIVTTATVLCYRKPVKVEMTVRGHASLDAEFYLQVT